MEQAGNGVEGKEDDTQDNEWEYKLLGDDMGEQDTRQVGEGREESTVTTEEGSEGDASIQRK